MNGAGNKSYKKYYKELKSAYEGLYRSGIKIQKISDVLFYYMYRFKSNKYPE
jgi:hypothetical protein